jgi:uncharacterized damage-inducible protein DinB
VRREHSLAATNVALLQQGIDLITDLDDELFRRPQAMLGMGSIGGHFRHCLDFYESFIRGIESGTIDYDSRVRDAQIESERLAALAKLRSIGAGLRDISSDDREIVVVLENSASRSSPARELQSLISHTTHHYALIAVALRFCGIEPGPTFGVADSTLKYWSKAS